MPQDDLELIRERLRAKDRRASARTRLARGFAFLGLVATGSGLVALAVWLWRESGPISKNTSHQAAAASPVTPLRLPLGELVRLGLTVDDHGGVVVVLDGCVASPTSVLLSSTDLGETLWKVRSASPVPLRTVQVGVTPPGFSVVKSLADPHPHSWWISVGAKNNVSIAFLDSTDKLVQGRILLLGEYLTAAEFEARHGRCKRDG